MKRLRFIANGMVGDRWGQECQKGSVLLGSGGFRRLSPGRQGCISGIVPAGVSELSWARIVQTSSWCRVAWDRPAAECQLPKRPTSTADSVHSLE